jgi:hypothetical protein
MRFGFTLAILLASITTAQAQTVFSGVWWDDKCSTMNLTKNGDVISGTYTIGVSGEAGAFSLIGFQVGDLIAFSVNFGSRDTLTSWVGQNTTERGVEKFVTRWHLVVDVSDNDEENSIFSSMMTGTDVFVRDKPSSCP